MNTWKVDMWPKTIEDKRAAFEQIISIIKDISAMEALAGYRLISSQQIYNLAGVFNFNGEGILEIASSFPDALDRIFAYLILFFVEEGYGTLSLTTTQELSNEEGLNKEEVFMAATARLDYYVFPRQSMELEHPDIIDEYMTTLWLLSECGYHFIENKAHEMINMLKKEPYRLPELYRERYPDFSLSSYRHRLIIQNNPPNTL